MEAAPISFSEYHSESGYYDSLLQLAECLGWLSKALGILSVLGMKFYARIRPLIVLL